MAAYNISFAQSSEDLGDDINFSITKFLTEGIIWCSPVDPSSHVTGEYDWYLYEDIEDTVHLGVHSAPLTNSSHLDTALTDFMTRVGKALEDYADEIEVELEDYLQTEEKLLEFVHENNGTANTARQFGHELKVNAGLISANLVNKYNKVGEDYSQNVNNATDKLNEALNSLPNAEFNDEIDKTVVNITEDAIKTSSLTASNYASEIAGILCRKKFQKFFSGN